MLVEFFFVSVQVFMFVALSRIDFQRQLLQAKFKIASTNSNLVSGSAISEEDLQQLQALAAEERAAAEGPSKSPSPVAPPPPPPPAPSSGKRHSIVR